MNTLKVLYGVQGTGNGHITRARALAAAFKRTAGIQVDYLFSGRDAGKYFDMDVFDDYRTRRGLSFVHQNGAIDTLNTLRALRLWEWVKDVNELDLSEYQLVLNDFEPITAWAAKRQKIPSIAISHQAAFLHPVPKRGQQWLDRLIIKYFAPTDIHLGVHWYHFGRNIIPPFIQQHPCQTPSGSHILVYLPFENTMVVKALLEACREHRFEIFHPDVQHELDANNLRWRKPSREGFQRSLHSCAGVIAGGGFELASECLQLGKKMLIKPLAGQFEQLSNALTLERLALCDTMEELDLAIVQRWLSQPQGQCVTFPTDPQPLVDWILARQWRDTQLVCDKLWQQVCFPAPIRRKLFEMSAE